MGMQWQIFFFFFLIYWFSFTWYGFIYIYYISWMFNMTCRRWGCYVNTKAFFQKWCSKSARFVWFFMLFFSLLLQQLFFIRTWGILSASCKSTLKLFELFLKLLIWGTFLVCMFVSGVREIWGRLYSWCWWCSSWVLFQEGLFLLF